jgi:hypothetical protein
VLSGRTRAFASGALTALLLAGATGARADDPYEDLGGFEDEEFDSEVEFEEQAPAVPDRWWDLDGNVTVSSSINYLSHESATGDDFTGLSRLRLRLNLQLDLELPHDWELRVTPYIWYDLSYVINGFENFTKEVLDTYEWEGDFQDSYVEGPILDNLDLKLGRQVVNWGRSDSLRVVDVLNPLDNREPGRADIEDLRWAIGMAKLDWYLGQNWTLTGIAIPEIRFDDLPPVGSEFNPSPVPPPREIVPNSFERWEAAAAVRGIFEGWDASLHFAYIFDDLARLQPIIPPPNPAIPRDPRNFVQVHDRLTMVGAGGNYTTGSWLFKAEAAWFDGFDYAFAKDGDKSRLDVMGGIEYYGFSETTLALEVANRHLFDYERIVRSFPTFQREDSVEYAVRYSAEWMNARLNTTLLALIFGWKAQDGAVIRLQGDYTIRDGLVATAGMLLFQEGELPPLNTWGRNDRVFIDLKWSF